MRILGIDTAAGACSVALWSDGAILDRSEEFERGHAERLLPMVQELMAAAGVGLRALDAVAVTVGPGAFTGLRIGLAAARGIALAVGVPCFGVTTLEAIAEAAGRWRQEQAIPATLPLLVALDSKRRDYYGQVFAADASPLTPPQVADALRLAAAVPGDTVLVAGDGNAAIAAAIAAEGRQAIEVAGCRTPQAAAVVRLAAARWAGGERPPVAPAPLYLRAADTGPSTFVPAGGAAAEAPETGSGPSTAITGAGR